MLVLMPDLKVPGMVWQVAICQKETQQEVTTAGDQDGSQNDILQRRVQKTVGIAGRAAASQPLSPLAWVTVLCRVSTASSHITKTAK